MSRIILALACAAGAVVSLSAASTLKFDAPPQWTSQPPSSSMRTAQFVLPKAEGDPEDATAVVFFFGQGQGGGVEVNLDRWASQMVQADGKPATRQQARTATFTTGTLKVSTLDLTGAYAGGMGSGQRAAPGRSRMKAAVVETPGGNYFVRVLGPAKTITKWDAAIDRFFKSFRYGA